ncbi:hypothetical protein BTVI_82500 [Pitangus sulphuratus]|nr:hypothetical protein BTVI_82500 [Pitangus sulphuratus]
MVRRLEDAEGYAEPNAPGSWKNNQSRDMVAAGVELAMESIHRNDSQCVLDFIKRLLLPALAVACVALQLGRFKSCFSHQVNINLKTKYGCITFMDSLSNTPISTVHQNPGGFFMASLHNAVESQDTLKSTLQKNAPEVFQASRLEPTQVKSPKLDTGFEVQPHQCRVQEDSHFPGSPDHTIFDTSQDTFIMPYIRHPKQWLSEV